jgi:hypothetical protein
VSSCAREPPVREKSRTIEPACNRRPKQLQNITNVDALRTPPEIELEGQRVRGKATVGLAARDSVNAGIGGRGPSRRILVVRKDWLENRQKYLLRLAIRKLGYFFEAKQFTHWVVVCHF